MEKVDSPHDLLKECCKKVIKLGAIHLTTTLLSDGSSNPNYGHKLKTTCSLNEFSLHLIFEKILAFKFCMLNFFLFQYGHIFILSRMNNANVCLCNDLTTVGFPK